MKTEQRTLDNRVNKDRKQRKKQRKFKSVYREMSRQKQKKSKLMFCSHSVADNKTDDQVRRPRHTATGSMRATHA